MKYIKLKAFYVLPLPAVRRISMPCRYPCHFWHTRTVTPMMAWQMVQRRVFATQKTVKDIASFLEKHSFGAINLKGYFYFMHTYIYVLPIRSHCIIYFFVLLIKYVPLMCIFKIVIVTHYKIYSSYAYL